MTEKNIHIVDRLLEDDRQLTVAEIHEVEIRCGSAQAIIIDDLGFRKVFARWIPSLLIED